MKSISLRESILLRMAMVGILGLLLLILVAIVSTLVGERAHRRDATIREVTEKWGLEQTLIGPILSLPVKVTEKRTDGVVKTHIEYAHFLPDSLSLKAQISPEIRYRGIYRVVLYNARLTMNAEFASVPPQEGILCDGEILWNEAFFSVGLSDLKGIRSLSDASLGQQTLVSEPGLRTRDLFEKGFTFRAPLTPGEKPGRFALDASVNGSEGMRIVPLGKKTSVAASAPWGSPSFIGDFLPETREIAENSFSAHWSVLQLNGNLPQSWVGAQPRLGSSSFGVKLLMPVDEYLKNTRAVKYAIMFIALTFLAFAIVDILCASPFHPIHYTLVGLALILFFVLLLSLSEHLSFNVAYGAAAMSVLLTISLYTRGVSRRWSVTASIATVLVVLYTFLFILLQLEDYALLLGSAGLSVSLATVMYLTRRIDWFGVGTPNSAPFRDTAQAAGGV